MLVARYLETHAYVCQRVQLFSRNLKIEVLVAVFRIATLRVGKWGFDLHATDRLVRIRLRQRNPNL